MQALRLFFVGVLAFVVIRSAPVFYHSSEFNSYVQQQASSIRSRGVLKEVILLNAEKNRIPMTAQNINFTTSDSGLQVSVEYQIPLDLFLYRKEVSFRAAGTGIFAED